MFSEKGRIPWVIFIVVAGLIGSHSKGASEELTLGSKCQDSDKIRFRGFTTRIENDVFARTDQNYTNGLAITAVSHDIDGKLHSECLPMPVRLHADFIKWVNPVFWTDTGDSNVTPTQNVVVKFGQSIFTPKDPEQKDLVPNDRPFAGLLFVGMSWNRRKRKPQSTWETLDTREVTLGLIGPGSLAKETQNYFHDLIKSERFLGWDHQLRNEPAIQLATDRKLKQFRSESAIIPGFSADTISSLGLRLGNIETSFSVGIEGRLGWNIPNDFGSYPIRPGAENRPPSAASINNLQSALSPGSGKPCFGMHLFANLEAKLVGHDFSLDGNLFRDSPHVTRRIGVSQAAIGFSVQGPVVKRGLKLAIMRVFRSREYEEQKAIHAYGSIALSLEF